MLFGYEWVTGQGDLAFAASILPMLLLGLVVTIQATVAGFFIAVILGLIFAALRQSRFRVVRYVTGFVVEFLRDTPLLVQLFFLYYVLPEFGIVLPAFMTGALALGVQYSAYTSEVYRAGIESVPLGQHEAARALDLTPKRSFMVVVLPQAIPRI